MRTNRELEKAASNPNRHSIGSPVGACGVSQLIRVLIGHIGLCSSGSEKLEVGVSPCRAVEYKG